MVTLDLDSNDRAALAAMLHQSFPDADIDDRTLAAVALTAYLDESSGVRLDWSRYRGPIEQYAAALGLVRAAGPQICRPVNERGTLRYYRVHAKHERDAPPHEPFTGHVGMVRVSLPRENQETVATAVGDVEPSDHLLATIAEVERKFGRYIDGEIDRVDLITPARIHGSRFAAVSVYLGYRAGQPKEPSFYVLEAGMATGEPKVLFFAKDFEQRIVSQSGYRPTPFSASDHVYTSRLTKTGDNPLQLQINAHRDAKSRPYLRLTAAFEETADPDTTWPAQHLLRASRIVAGRVLAGVGRDEV